MLKEKIITQIGTTTSLQEDALNHFNSLGFPTVKNEEWKYTNLLKWTKEDFDLQADEIHLPDYSSYLIEESYNLVVLINGVFQPTLSKIDSDIKVLSLEKALASEKIAKEHFSKLVDYSKDGLAALNTAVAEDGLFIHVSKSTTVENTVHILNLTHSSNALMSHPRILAVVEENAEARFVETHYSLGKEKTWNNIISEIYLKKSARLMWTKIQNDRLEDNVTVDNTFIHQEKDSTSNVYTFSLGGEMVRNNLNFRLDDEHIEANLSAATIINHDQHVDHHTFIDHAFPNCESNENYKGVFDGNAKGVFNGKVIVRKDAQKTNAYQNNANVLLSDAASVDTKPQLEIFADDVKCSHGCTVGHQDDEALFYMRQRGLSRSQAQGILNLAFVGEITDSIKVDCLKNYVLELIANKLNK